MKFEFAVNWRNPEKFVIMSSMKMIIIEGDSFFDKISMNKLFKLIIEEYISFDRIKISDLEDKVLEDLKHNKGSEKDKIQRMKRIEE
ncbi:hypothetical protein C2G38_2157937 [Gigaspora rosea]|uniref:Uncharacterized protein n=1 Tax=Gigaspora rosea TaxID=44941 RepID=A0A397WA51_9GLOM|nr:hypothetical protein C2G38_2157937 [Gigaspora rosea]